MKIGGLILSICAMVCMATTAYAADKKPNILIIWGDDVGMWNISASIAA